jgi:hypothetical protein
LRKVGIFVQEMVYIYINTPTFLKPVILHTYRPMKMEQTECSETLAHKIQMPGNYPEESIQQVKTMSSAVAAKPTHMYREWLSELPINSGTGSTKTT